MAPRNSRTNFIRCCDFFSFSLLLLGWMGIEEKVRMLSRKKCTISRKAGPSTRIFTTK
jgi:hypothetical protein